MQLNGTHGANGNGLMSSNIIKQHVLQYMQCFRVTFVMLIARFYQTVCLPKVNELQSAYIPQYLSFHSFHFKIPYITDWNAPDNAKTVTMDYRHTEYTSCQHFF